MVTNCQVGHFNGANRMKMGGDNDFQISSLSCATEINGDGGILFNSFVGDEMVKEMNTYDESKLYLIRHIFRLNFLTENH